MKQKYILLVSLGLVVSACTNTQQSSIKSYPPLPSSSSPSSESVSLFSDDPDIKRTDDSLPYATEVNNGLTTKTVAEVLTDFKKVDYGYYGGNFEEGSSYRLEAPKNTITTHDELVGLLDYCAFYRIKESTFSLQMSGNPIEECNLAIWDSTMIPGTVGTVIEDKGDGTVKVQFKYVDDANSFVPKRFRDIYLCEFPYIYDYKDEHKEKLVEIPYVGGTQLTVHNSDQLIYAITHGYKPVMAENSPAKKIYDIATNILKQIIYKDMNDNEKLLAIEFYLSNNNHYDYTSDDSAAFISANHKNNVEELSALFRGFYAEGALFNGGAVCYGFAKAQALLSGLLGFKARLTHGRIDNLSKDSNDAVTNTIESSTNIYNAHGISLVRKDDNSKWGICDPTFRSAGALKFDRDYVEFKRRPAIMMSPEEWTLTYESADEVAFKYIPREEIVEKSYNFVDDYRLVGGARLDPKNTRDLDATFTGIIDTIVKAKELTNAVYQGYYSITLYPDVLDDDEAMSLYTLYDETLLNHRLYSMNINYYRYRTAEYFNQYGYTIAVKY